MLSPLQKETETDKEIIQWINIVLNENNDLNDDLYHLIKDGKKLCQIANKVIQNPSNKMPHKLTAPYFIMENIEYFINAVKEVGVPDHYNFLTVDLYEGKDMRQVKIAIMSFARYCHKKKNSFPLIGPKEATKSEIKKSMIEIDSFLTDKE
ncbi:Myophilin [Ecytonucleospora hepatopenaei]|uniref:Myophilin n=1 Tax=Ecytonucleospora hepatopenaei TaxID=646526 RepID=A0A1W0E921_9MICR|nr:hypothetical protein EHP00_2589 [Ecytonucleospora hepatopenaei]OQS55757.1 Myophilin [Ecytonucleospora hepatopenaei]